MFSRVLQRLSAAVLAISVTACASWGVRLQPGVSTLSDVVGLLGQPAMVWQDPDGRQQLAYPLGPEGTETFMVFVGADGLLQTMEKVLDTEHFARIESGRSTQADVLRLLGPSLPSGTAYFKWRDELVWEWRYCDAWGQRAFFDVLFDASTGIVRTTYSRPDLMRPRGLAMPCSAWLLPLQR